MDIFSLLLDSNHIKVFDPVILFIIYLSFFDLFLHIYVLNNIYLINFIYIVQNSSFKRDS